MLKKFSKLIFFVATAILVGITAVYAGSLTRPGSVSKTMYTLTDVYNLASGVTAPVPAGNIPATPSSESSTFHTITETYNVLSTQMSRLSAGVMATGTTAFGVVGTLYGSADPSKVLTSATYPGTAYASTPLKTGQTTCYLANGATSTPCAGTGQDGELQKGASRQYTDNGTTVTDNTTGLVWQKCSRGLSGTSCGTGTVSTTDWASAVAYCNANTAGLPGTGWRLPNFTELTSILDYSRASPAINVTYFPVTSSNLYWSATTYQSTYQGSSNQYYAWYVHFYGGDTSYDAKTTSYYVRCVRG